MMDIYPDIVYVVTKGNDTLRVGDHFWMDSFKDNNHLNCVEVNGFLTDDESKQVLEEIEFEIDFGWEAKTSEFGSRAWEK